MATKLSKSVYRPSTIARYKLVHSVYAEVVGELGDFAALVPKSYLYDRINARTGLCYKTIAHVLNHTIDG